MHSEAVHSRARKHKGRSKIELAEKMLMKIIASGLLVLGLLAVQVSAANAVVCARGVYHAGCAGAGGAAVVRRPVGGAAVVAPHGAAVVHPAVGVRCVYRAGVRVCR
jgi:hypothetical protein